MPQCASQLRLRLRRAEEGVIFVPPRGRPPGIAEGLACVGGDLLVVLADLHRRWRCHRGTRTTALPSLRSPDRRSSRAGNDTRGDHHGRSGSPSRLWPWVGLALMWLKPTSPAAKALAAVLKSSSALLGRYGGLTRRGFSDLSALSIRQHLAEVVVRILAAEDEVGLGHLFHVLRCLVVREVAILGVELEQQRRRSA